MAPELALVETLRSTLTERLRQADQQIQTLQIQRDVILKLLEPQELEAFAEQTASTLSIRMVQPDLIENALLEEFRSKSGAMRWTDAMNALVERGIAAMPGEVIDILKKSSYFVDSGQGWWRSVPMPITGPPEAVGRVRAGRVVTHNRFSCEELGDARRGQEVTAR